MKRTTSLFGTSALALTLASSAALANVTLGPAVEPQGPGRVAVVWESSSSGPEAITLTSPGRPDRTATSTITNGIHRAELTNLEPGVEYAYRVSDRDGRFISPPGATQDVRFAVFGDSRDGDDVHRQIVARVAAERPDFYMTTGDTVPTGRSMGEWRNFFEIERPLMSNTPFMGVQGNHDVGGLFTSLIAMHSETPGATRTWGSMDLGPVHFLLVDTESAVDPASPQGQFIERDLAAHQDQPIVALMHKPLFSSGQHGSALQVQRGLGPVFQRYGVDVVFQGHDHHYERTNAINGVTYVVTGGAGAPLRGVGRNTWTAVSESCNHFTMVEASATRIRVTATRIDGTQLDAFEVDPRANNGQFQASTPLPSATGAGLGCSASPVGPSRAAALAPVAAAMGAIAWRSSRRRRALARARR